MQQLAFAFLGALVQGAGTLTGRVLTSLGIGYVTYTGVDASIAWVESKIAASFSAFPIEALQILSALKVGEGVAVILGALTGKLVWNGLTSGTVKKMVMR